MKKKLVWVELLRPMVYMGEVMPAEARIECTRAEAAEYKATGMGFIVDAPPLTAADVDAMGRNQLLEVADDLGVNIKPGASNAEIKKAVIAAAEAE